MSHRLSRGLVYRCPVCGAEIAVLATRHGEFSPRCCNVDMTPLRRHLPFCVCPVCGAEIALLHDGGGERRWRCCNTDMVLAA